MKQKSTFRISVTLAIFTILSVILSACSNTDENHGEDLKEMIKNDSQIQRVTYGEPFYNVEDDGIECSEEEKIL